MNTYNSVLLYLFYIYHRFIVILYNFCNQLAEITVKKCLTAQICTKIFFLQFKEAALKNFCQLTKRKY